MGPVRESLPESAPDQAPPSAATSRARLRPWGPLRRWQIWTSLAVVLVIALGVTAWRMVTSGPAPITRAEVARSIQQGIQKAQQEQRKAPPDATTAYRTIMPSLVTVTTEQGSLGAGVVIKADGTVLTALHVIEDGSPVRVEFADGTTSPAAVSTRQPASDIAVLAISKRPEVVVPAVLGGGAEVGSAVFSAGNPLGLRETLTAGVVSGLDRSTGVKGGVTLHGLIQFDAAVNPGNSGGPLLNRDGQVIGIVTGLANPSKQPYFIGIGFAVPIKTAGGAAGGPLK